MTLLGRHEFAAAVAVLVLVPVEDRGGLTWSDFQSPRQLHPHQ